MSKVLVTKAKLDTLASIIGGKSDTVVPLTLDEMVEAADSIQTGGGVTPTGNIDITKAGVTDVTNYATATVAEAVPYMGKDYGYYTLGGTRKWRVRGVLTIDSNDENPAGYIDDGTYYGSYTEFNAIATGTSVTPTESSQTIGGLAYMMEGPVTVNAIPSNYVGSGITQRSSSDLTASGATVTAPAGYYASAATKTVSSGSEGTPTATKGTVSNHSVSVTPSVTNTAGYISGGTHSGTAVSVSASELVSGNLAITENGTGIDVTNYETVSVAVSGGGSSTMTIGTKTTTLSTAASSISFTGLSGNPLSFVVTSSTGQATGGTAVVAVAYDGTSLHGMDLTTQAEADTGFTKSYSSGTLTITATTATFEANEYKLVYAYGGSSSDIHTADVQVGSGATSITFSGLSGRPMCFSCVFKSTFSTSSGYQRVMDVVFDGTNTYGHALDSSAKAQTSWNYAYSGGSLTITSTGTNNGGYFHQPGYYGLVYAVDPNALTFQNKTGVSASTSSQTIYADSGYDALESVQINAISQTNLTAANIKSGTTISISNGSTNLWSVTGTYTGSGGGSSIDTKTVTSSNRPTSLSFTGMKGEPIAFFLRCTSSMSRSSNSTYYYVADMRFNGSNTTGNCWRMSNGNWTNITSGYSWSYSGTTLTLTSNGSSTASPGCFYPGNYELVYLY